MLVIGLIRIVTLLESTLGAEKTVSVIPGSEPSSVSGLIGIGLLDIVGFTE